MSIVGTGMPIPNKDASAMSACADPNNWLDTPNASRPAYRLTLSPVMPASAVSTEYRPITLLAMILPWANAPAPLTKPAERVLAAGVRSASVRALIVTSPLWLRSCAPASSMLDKILAPRSTFATLKPRPATPSTRTLSMADTSTSVSMRKMPGDPDCSLTFRTLPLPILTLEANGLLPLPISVTAANAAIATAPAEPERKWSLSA